MRKLLRDINSLPFRFTIEYYHPTSDGFVYEKERLDSPELWYALRERHPHFSIPRERNEWVNMCELGIGRDGLDGSLNTRAVEIVDLLTRSGFNRMHSVGVGSAALEYHIKRLFSKLELVCSDHAPSTVEILQGVFSECDSVRKFDVLDRESWTGLENHKDRVIMINRLDPLFSDERWEQVFRNMHDCGVEHVLFISAWMLTLRYYLMVKKENLLSRIRRTQRTFTGWVRTKRVFQSYWESLYEEEEELILGGLPAFLLKRR